MKISSVKIPEWKPSTFYSRFDLVQVGGIAFREESPLIGSTISGSHWPDVGTSDQVIDGTCVWRRLGPVATEASTRPMLTKEQRDELRRAWETDGAIPNGRIVALLDSLDEMERERDALVSRPVSVEMQSAHEEIARIHVEMVGPNSIALRGVPEAHAALTRASRAARERAEAAERERDEWKTRAEKAEALAVRRYDALVAIERATSDPDCDTGDVHLMAYGEAHRAP